MSWNIDRFHINIQMRANNNNNDFDDGNGNDYYDNCNNNK